MQVPMFSVDSSEKNLMNDKTEAALNTAVAIFVLFVAMLDPRISAGLAILFLVALSVYKFAHSRGAGPK
jgi:hypothetical protein